ncbi:adenosylcobinamide-GDP ribazoletransferase [Fervidobacterium sp.]
MWKELLTDFLLTLSFISRLPVKIKNIDEWEKRIRRTPIYFPVIGYIPGAIYSFAIVLANSLSTYKLLFVFGAMAIGYYFFDLFHFDGLLDMFDGFLNQSNKERRLEIMAKGDVGPFAVFYGMLYVLLFYQLMSTLDWQAFLFASVFGRYEMGLLLTFSKPAKPKGLGAMLFPYNKRYTAYSVIFLIPLLFISPLMFFISLTLTITMAYLISRVSEIKIGGITGDVLGGSCLISQMVVLLAFYIFHTLGR